MAGDWIKMRTNLDTNPKVIQLATEFEVSELTIVGALWKLWSWADSHSIDGNAIVVTHVTLDRFTGITGFADMLRKVGWLEGRDGALCFPRFAEHNGQTAKKRAETKDRVRKCRNNKPVTDVTQKVLPEKRREEKSISLSQEAGDSEEDEQLNLDATGKPSLNQTDLSLIDEVISAAGFKSNHTQLSAEAREGFRSMIETLRNQTQHTEILANIAEWRKQADKAWTTKPRANHIPKHLGSILDGGPWYNDKPKANNGTHRPSNTRGSRTNGTANEGKASLYAKVGRPRN